MRRPAGVVVVASVAWFLSSAPVAGAETPSLDLHVGVGLPAGGVGLGTRIGPVEVLAEGEFLGAAFVMMASAGLHVNVDVVRRPRWALYIGGFAAVMSVVAGSDEVFEETYQGGGAVAGVRLHGRGGTLSHALEAGAFYARCANHDGMCNDGKAFVSFDLAYRLQFHLF